MSLTGMNIEEVESMLTQLSQGADRLDELTLQVNNLQGPLTDAWEGVEATACVDYLNRLSTKMKDMSEELMKLHSWVEQTKNNYEEVASSGASAYMS
ncbi:MAG: WXG100 family type VII secretion target [Pseudobutyrivibrio sp.]|nr:WXG100 family type VII secretion target [Pseudobutyrivibrio sp.]